jgi:predicted methyltransferase
VRSAEREHIVGEVAAAVGLAEGTAGVDTVLAALARLEPVSTRRLSRAVDLPVPIVASVCGELRKRAILAEERPSRLTARGRRLFGAGALDLGRASECPTCAGRGIPVLAELGPVAAELSALMRDAPPPRLEVDQCHCTIGTKLRRVLAIHAAGGLVGRRLLLLGDDDFVSLAIAGLVRRFGSGPTVGSLTVVDVDAAVVAYAEAALADAPFPVTCLRHDLRDPLPRELDGAADTVVTDPPYTVEGAKLFLTRAVEALAGPGSSVFLSFGSRRPGAGFRVQRLIGDLGLAIHQLVRDFNDYVGAGALAGTSHLYHLVATTELRRLQPVRFDGPLYTAEAQGA